MFGVFWFVTLLQCTTFLGLASSLTIEQSETLDFQETSDFFALTRILRWCSLFSKDKKIVRDVEMNANADIYII